jgi:hypothetical protein
MAALNGPVYVPAPNPVIPRYGLFAVATGPLEIPIHARIGGLQYELSTCVLPVGYEVHCQADLDTKSFEGAIDTNIGYPFVVYAGITCGVVGLANWGQERIQKYLYEQLVAGEQATVESIFSTSGFGQTAGLANNAATVNLGTATDIVNAFSILEDWLYTRYGLPGVIHAPMEAAAYIKNAHLVEQATPTDAWKTPVGTKVSFGNYAGVNPTGGPPTSGSTWIYITGQVAIWRTPDSALLNIPLGQVIDRSTNNVEILLEREYVVTYDCFVAGVETVLAPPIGA